MSKPIFISSATCLLDLSHGGPTTLSVYAKGPVVFKVLTCATTKRILRIYDMEGQG